MDIIVAHPPASRGMNDVPCRMGREDRRTGEKKWISGSTGRRLDPVSLRLENLPIHSVFLVKKVFGNACATPKETSVYILHNLSRVTGEFDNRLNED
ncbi:hypothetical protein AVEN_146015-1 [Araneus ventricosus]|uniref:Uncharacterized protein n=1 Tax=Araneus ventricosus TaxID=182803 RepID=A0A4Y2SN20_ARAVE|nr:hypothetical protein AVEN_146015-1 [Araneus ventricosus]